MARFGWIVAGWMVLPGMAPAEDAVVLPSGQSVTLIDVILEDTPSVARFRFLAPEIGAGGRTYEEVLDDFPWLCEALAVPALQEAGVEVVEVVVSLSDRVVPFGEADPEATQFFEPFTLDGTACIWEQF
ncbi:DUF6497 family protein [Loktanella sp. IMCC34160]|uniref:DUF6497 family protein n=1 Tax=Loktanella sp. IMCC34160 TaxID=2510646 RepID=UPI001F5C228F|nr:DUF6497 family protein [Loktanella sp. IMCC34160]